MSFSPRERQWWLRVWGNGDPNAAKCRHIDYSEEKGFFEDCRVRGSNNIWVTRWRTGVGEERVGVPMCRRHAAVTKESEVVFENGWPLYPDVARAMGEYPDDKNSFRTMLDGVDGHPPKIEEGFAFERVFSEWAQQLEQRYHRKNPDDKKPSKRFRRAPDWKDKVLDDV